MTFRRLIAAIRGMRNRRARGTTLETACPTMVDEASSRRDDLIVFSMDTSSEGILDTLDKDTIIFVLSLLDMPSDLARAACVCCSWRRCVLEGKLWKNMCFKLFPEIGRDYKFSNHSEGLSPNHRDVIKRDATKQLQCLEAESAASELLLERLLRPPMQRTCISESLHASSTDNLPRESVAQTLYPEPEYPDMEISSYWSSTGRGDTSVPETLTYRLVSDLCVVHNVKIRPFLAHFQIGNPIYSSQMVRFRCGYSKFAKPHWSGLFECFLDVPRNAKMDEYVWTYVSPTFPMVQEDTVQTFQLPKPTLCFGSIFQIEFIGRVQTQESDQLYYICICHVHVTGRPLSDFKFEGIDENGGIILKHLSQKERPSSLIQTYWGSHLERNNVSRFMEYVRSNRNARRNRSIEDMLLQYLLDAGLFKERESDDD